MTAIWALVALGAAAAAGLAMTWRARRGAALLGLHVTLALVAIVAVMAVYRGLGGAGLAAFLAVGLTAAMGAVLLATPADRAPPRALLWGHGIGAAVAGLALVLALA